jgi:hypothetical protein
MTAVQNRVCASSAGTIEFHGAQYNRHRSGSRGRKPGPHEIILSVPTSQLRRHGYIVWRKEKRIGVVFD